MKTSKRFIEVAVAGPLRQTFTYHVDLSEKELHPGQRLLIPFGRARKVGFYLGTTSIPEFATKPIIRRLDQESFIPLELFRFVLWLSGYYFANPADALTSALPSVLKSHRPVQYRWSDKIASPLSGELLSMYRPGKKISTESLAKINFRKKLSVTQLCREGIIIEEFGSAERKKAQLFCYSVKDEVTWRSFYETLKFSPDYFKGEKSRVELSAEGWSAYRIKQALTEGLLETVPIKPIDRILEFVPARDDVSALKMTEEQEVVHNKIKSTLGNGFQVSLLHGVTGSGKTLIYCKLVDSVLKQGNTVLVLTPEIALTGAILSYFRGFFGDRVTVVHSAMTERERLESWQGIRKGKYRVVIGPRSALFAPLENPGLIIVDEEHDGSYKQDDPSPRFHGRDAAIMRAKMCDIPILLGSASPSIESYYNATKGRYSLTKLTSRPAGAVLPEVQMVDLRKERAEGTNDLVSFKLKKAIEKQLSSDKQVILYLNRRGYAPQSQCKSCGHIPSCPNCDVRLTYHRAGHKLVCHYCGYMQFNCDSCEACGSTEFLFKGTGTQKLEDILPGIIPETRAVRFDSDTASGRKKGYRILSDFASGKYNTLLGTQMVSKGLDLPGVTLVGVLSADQGLQLPDFRADEKSFSRLLQVAGRSGRTSTRGIVLFQSYDPSHRVVQAAARQDYESFFESEIELRKKYRYPPFCRLLDIVISGSDETKLIQSTERLKKELLERLDKSDKSAEILGPAPCPIYYMRNQFRRRILIKTDNMVKLVRTFSQWESSSPRFGLPSSVKITIDIDPDNMM